MTDTTMATAPTTCFTRKEVADELRVCEKTIQRAFNRGQGLPGWRQVKLTSETHRYYRTEDPKSGTTE